MTSTFKSIVLGTALVAATCTVASAFDRQTTDALKACHDTLWDLPEYTDLPNAAISVWPGWINDDSIKVYWVVDWTDPDVQAAGQCVYADGKIAGYERF